MSETPPRCEEIALEPLTLIPDATYLGQEANETGGGGARIRVRFRGRELVLVTPECTVPHRIDVGANVSILVNADGAASVMPRG